MKGLAILGSTGSVGRQTLEVVRSFPGEFSVVGLAAGYNLELLAQEAEEFHPKVVSCQGPEEVSESRLPPECRMVSQEELASHPEVDMVVAAGQPIFQLVGVIGAAWLAGLALPVDGPDVLSWHRASYAASACWA